MAEDTWDAMIQTALDKGHEKPKTRVSEGTLKNKM
jgi:hypothetical protein